MSDLVKIYNPANASALTSEQINKLQTLSSDEIKELAKAYPNMTMSRAYLLIIDSRKPVEKQLPALSSFENLWNLREKNGLRNYVAYRFRDNYKPAATATASRRLPTKRTEVLDLSEKDLLNLPGFKTAGTQHPAQTVEVTKIKKVTEPATNGEPPKAKGKPGRKSKSQTTI